VEIYDISMLLRPEMVVWPGDNPFAVEPAALIADGASANVSRLMMGSHTGTHVDAPLHFIDKGASVDQLDLGRLVGPAEVLDLTGRRAIDAAALENRLAPGRFALFKTNSSYLPDTAPFRDDYVYLTPDGARAVVDSGVRTIGIDYLSVGGGSEGAVTHRILLEAGVVVIEGLRLAEVAPGGYTLAFLPLKVQGCDGAPGRAVLFRQ